MPIVRPAVRAAGFFIAEEITGTEGGAFTNALDAITAVSASIFKIHEKSIWSVKEMNMTHAKKPSREAFSESDMFLKSAIDATVKLNTYTRYIPMSYEPGLELIFLTNDNFVPFKK